MGTAPRSPWSPDRADIITVHPAPHSAAARLPVQALLVCSTRGFNERTGIVIGFPLTNLEANADNPLALRLTRPTGEFGYVLAFQPKSFDWRSRRAEPHAWGGGHVAALRSALRKLDAICGVSQR